MHVYTYAKEAAGDASTATNATEDKAGVGVPTNSDILGAICALKEDISTQSANMMEAVNDIKNNILSHSKRMGEAEERIMQTEEDMTALQQKVGQLKGMVDMLRTKSKTKKAEQMLLSETGWSSLKKTAGSISVQLQKPERSAVRKCSSRHLSWYINRHI